jgi:hypothetical protein
MPKRLSLQQLKSLREDELFNGFVHALIAAKKCLQYASFEHGQMFGTELDAILDEVKKLKEKEREEHELS